MPNYKIYKKEQILRLVEEQENNGYFDNWIMPSNQDLELEYKIEYTFKGLGDTIYREMKSLGYDIDRNVFSNSSEFVEAVHDSDIVIVDSDLDEKIGYRSNCPDMECIIELIQGYAS